MFFEAMLYRHFLCRYIFARVAAAIGEWRAHTHSHTHEHTVKHCDAPTKTHTHTHTEMLARTHTGE